MTAFAGLTTKPNITDTDHVYEQLLAAHKGLTEAESHALNTRLVLILANHIGEKAVLQEALALALKAKPDAKS